MDDAELLDLIATAIVDGTDMDCTARDQAASVLRALRANGLVVGKVKPLEWADWSARHRLSATAKSPAGVFRVTQRHFPETFFCIELPDGVPVTSATFDAAKAAAQADYEARIRGAIE